jgi:hypothetical protein
MSCTICCLIYANCRHLPTHPFTHASCACNLPACCPAVNAAALAQSLPAQLRKALAPTLTRNSPVASGARVTVRKLVKQRSASSLGLAAAAAAAGAGAGATCGGAVRMTASSEGGTPSSAAAAASVGPRSGAASALAGGSAGAGVAATLAAAAAAVAGGSAGAAALAGAGETIRGRGSGERQPLLGAVERSGHVS